MPSRVYSKRFIAGLVDSSAADTALKYTVPVGKVAILKSADMFVSVEGGTFLDIQTGALLVQFLSITGVPVFRTATWRGTIVLEAGESVHPQHYGGSANVSVSGYLLDAV